MSTPNKTMTTVDLGSERVLTETVEPDPAPAPNRDVIPLTEDGVTEAMFRKAGYTAAAASLPLSQTAYEAKCAFNGVHPKFAPNSWRYAPNDYMRKYWENGQKFPKSEQAND